MNTIKNKQLLPIYQFIKFNNKMNLYHEPAFSPMKYCDDQLKHIKKPKKFSIPTKLTIQQGDKYLVHSRSFIMKQNSTINFTQNQNQNKKIIWNNLYQRGIELKKKIQTMHKQKDDQIDKQCTFQPTLRNRNDREFGTDLSDFFDRNSIWLQNKHKKIEKQKKQIANLDMRQCTFSPIINKKAKLKLRASIEKQKRIINKQNKNENRIYDECQYKKTQINFYQARKNIRFQLNRLKL